MHGVVLHVHCRYYPKLQVCVPFTPATGSRLLVKPGPLSTLVFKALAQTLVTLTGTTGSHCAYIVFFLAPHLAHIIARHAHAHVEAASQPAIGPHALAHSPAAPNVIQPIPRPHFLSSPHPFPPPPSLPSLLGELGVSSLHITFPTGEEWAALGSLGFQQRRGIQYHWENRGYATFDDFLADLKQRKRKSIRQVGCCMYLGLRVPKP